MATKIKDTLSHADKFKEFGLFRERTTLVFPLFSDSINLALQRFMKFLTEDMGWNDVDAQSAADAVNTWNEYEDVAKDVAVKISSVRMDNNLVIHCDAYHYEDR